MFGYYVDLGLRSLRRNIVLTILVIVTIGVGIGSSMTVFTVLMSRSRDPIPEKSATLFTPKIDIWTAQDPDPRHRFVTFPYLLTFRDATALMHDQRGSRQSVMYGVRLAVSAAAARPFSAHGRAVSRDFFTMFQVPFSAGSAWSAADDVGRANVVILAANLAQRLFPRGKAVGQSLELEGRQYRILGVLGPWNPTPRFYDLGQGDLFGEAEQFFIPFSTAIEQQILTDGQTVCSYTRAPDPGWQPLLDSECGWIHFWVELPTIQAAQTYLQYLSNYASAQRQSGRFKLAPSVALTDVRTGLAGAGLISDELRLSALAGFGFLLLCLINVVGLMLAKFYSRAAEIGVRRALGASRTDIFMQCFAETSVVGTLGGMLGLALTAVGLVGERMILGSDLGRLAHFDAEVITITLVLAFAATVCSGLYPTWRASGIQPAWHLKTR